MKFMWSCLLALMVAGVGAPAVAADELGLSNDGTTWGSTLTRPIFDPHVRWVPGDSRTASFYVRNQGPTRASMTIEARSGDADQLLALDDITLSARADGGAWVDLINGVPSIELTDTSIARGAVVRVDVNASADWASPNRSQTKELNVAFRVTVTNSLESSAGSADPDSGVLPGTGASMGPWVLLVSAGLVTFGLLLAGRRREVDDV